MKDDPFFGQKEHASVDVNYGFILATTLAPASVSDTNYLPYCTVYSRHTDQPIKKVYQMKYVQETFALQFHPAGADKEYLPSEISLREPAEGWISPDKGKPNRDFLAGNTIADGIMRKDSTNAKGLRKNKLTFYRANIINIVCPQLPCALYRC